ncbi:MAG: hypothetical protein BM556_02280 [Bacteriovorax sp. MedPE-SWde]|nr:MAG: hypothetical protein BM556_02280 [Bacteriovorax sp. MedPE-SWde]
MFKNYIVLALILTSYSSHASIKSLFSWANIKERIVTEVANLDISFDVDLIDSDITRGVGTNIFYKYEVEPSFIPDKYLRVDRWSFNVNLRPGDIIDKVSPVYSEISKGSDLYFIRNFDSQLKAIKAMPYSFNKLPVDAKTTMERLNIGDYVSYPSTMSLSLGAKAASGTGPIKVEGLVGMLLRGKFTINIYRVDEKHVRLKLVANTYNSARASVGTKSDINITGVGIVDDKLKGLVFHNLLSVYGEYGMGEQYIVDYVFDLTNKDSREAYDAILRPSYKINFKDMIGKYSGIEFFENKLISDFSLAEELSKNGNGVERNFKGFNKYRFKKNGIKIGLLISKIRKGSAYYKNKITVEGRDGELHRYFFPNRVSFYEEEMRVGTIKRKDEFETSYHGLVSLDKDDVGKKYSDVGMSFWRDDKFLNTSEWKKMEQLIRDTLPRPITRGISFAELRKKGSKENTKIKIQVLFKENAFDHLRNITLKEVRSTLLKLVQERQVVKKTFLGRFVSRTGQRLRNTFMLERSSVRSMSKKIHNLLTNPKFSARERVSKLIDMPDRLMFKRYGLKLLMSLIPQDRWESDLFLKLEVLGKDIKGIRYELGSLKLSEVYKQVLLINKELHDPSRDMRLIVEK